MRTFGWIQLEAVNSFKKNNGEVSVAEGIARRFWQKAVIGDQPYGSGRVRLVASAKPFFLGQLECSASSPFLPVRKRPVKA